MQKLTTSPGIDSKLANAMQALQANRPADAIVLLEKLCKKNKRDAHAWFLLSSAYGMKGSMQDVKRCALQVLNLSPEHPGALTFLGNFYAAMGQHQQSAHYYQRALRQTPNDASLLFNMGMALNFAEKFQEATEYFKKALTVNPGNAHARAGLGEALMAGGRAEEAIHHLNVALQVNPELFLAHRGLGAAYQSVGQLEKAAEHFQKALQISNKDGDTITSYANLVSQMGDTDKALELLDEAIGRMPGHPALLAGKANLLEHRGEFPEAFQLASALEANGRTTPASAAVLLNVSRRFDYCEQALAIANRLLKKNTLLGSDIQTLGFAAGRLLDKLGRYDEAFDAFKHANDSVPIHYYHDKICALNDRLITTFSKEYLASLPRATNQDQRPIFIIGMPRSGTTLTEQILASHPAVYGAGELRDINQLACEGGNEEEIPAFLARIHHLTPADLDQLAQRYLHKLDTIAPGASRVTDKMPQNFIYLALILLLFPRATIIHCRRNPIDTCLSLYFQHFNLKLAFASDLENLGRYYLEYERLMAHWEKVLDKPILTVQYEETVADQEGMTRKMLAHCGLEWDDACLEFHKLKRDVKTASYDQVRKKMYSSSVERWRRYESHIEPLIRILETSPQIKQGG